MASRFDGAAKIFKNIFGSAKPAKPSPQKYAEWERLIGKVQTGTLKADVEQILGNPSRTIFTGEMEILSYRDEQIGDALYGIRVAFADNRVCQCYLGFELCEGDGRPKSQKRSERFQLLLVVILAAIGFLIYSWWQMRQSH
jgi:hypothetical protein